MKTTKNYSSFQNRMINSIIGYYLFVFLLIVLVLFWRLNNIHIFNYIFMAYWLVFIYYLFNDFVRNKILIKSINIDNEQVIIEYYLYNKFISTQFNITNTELKIEQESYNTRGGKKFVLVILNNKIEVCRQYQRNGWTKEEFKDIYTYTATLQNRKPFVNFLDW